MKELKASDLRIGNLVIEKHDIVKVAPVHISDQAVADLKKETHLAPIPLINRRRATNKRIDDHS